MVKFMIYYLRPDAGSFDAIDLKSQLTGKTAQRTQDTFNLFDLTFTKCADEQKYDAEVSSQPTLRDTAAICMHDQRAPCAIKLEMCVALC